MWIGSIYKLRMNKYIYNAQILIINKKIQWKYTDLIKKKQNGRRQQKISDDQLAQLQTMTALFPTKPESAFWGQAFELAHEFRVVYHSFLKFSKVFKGFQKVSKNFKRFQKFSKQHGIHELAQTLVLKMRSQA